MFLHVKSVRHVEDYRLRLEFDDGNVKEVDLAGELHGEVFEPLRDLAFVKKVAVDPETGTIRWPNGADFAPEFLPDGGKDVEHVA
jgi:hypothetical protein